MQDSVQLIKNKLSIEDVVAPYVSLKKKGKYMKACCPFHQEKTPSFVVSLDRQMAYCFGCQKGGDMFQFIQEIEGLDFRAALELLAEKANVELEKKSSGKPKISKDKKENLKLANALAIKFFVQHLWKNDMGKKVLDYLTSRGVTEKTIKTFEVGFAPESKDKLYRHLLEQDLKKDLIVESSLAIARDSESKNIVDRFHLRLMFPIHNVQGDPVAFGGRALKKGDNPKYLNSPEYVLYSKGSMLYNLHRAKKPIREKDLAVFVEGYFDVMASHQAGVENVVATSGTALGEDQFKLVKRYTKNVALAFDSDRAGQDALLRAVATAQSLGLELFVIEIPEGKDAADAVKEDPSLWTSAVANKKPYLEFFLQKLRARHDLNLPTEKRAFTDGMLEILQGVPHPVDQDHYLKEVSKLVGTPVDMLYDFLNQLKNNTRKHRKPKEKVVEMTEKTKKERLFTYFVGLILVYPKVFFELFEEIQSFETFKNRAQALGLVRQLSKMNEDQWKSFISNLSDYLNDDSFEINASWVYKQVRDHYNLQGELDEAFYASAEKPDLLHRIAFQAEVQNPDEKLVSIEFEKLITLLYLDFASS